MASDRFATFQANLNEIYFELIQLQAGYFLRLETNTNQSMGHGVNQSVGNQALIQNKRILQQAFQFSYDPLFKRFTRELRDQENKDFMIDKFYLGLKLKKDEAR